MSRFRVVWFSVFVVLAVSAVGASSASATIGFLWSVNGTKLQNSNETEKVSLFTDPQDPTVVFKATLLTVATELKGSEVSSKNSVIEGGHPGHSKGKVTFTNVTVSKPKNCTVHSTGSAAGTVETNETEGTIVESNTGGTVLVLFKAGPGLNGVLATLEFENNGGTCNVAGTKFPVTGSVAVSQDTPDTQKLQLWKFDPWGTVTRNSEGATVMNTLNIGGGPAELIGSFDAELARLLTWGGL